MQVNSMELYGRSLHDFLNGDVSAKILVHRDDGYTGDLPVSVFFRTPEDFSPLEQAAMQLCRGDVLDVGAGAGCHSLALQERGIKVLAIDISRHAVDIMAKRGVKEVQCVNVFDFQQSQFDTLLLMMHGIGLVENLSGLDRFLHHVPKLLKPNGQIVCDSLDTRYTNDPGHLTYQESNRRAGRYFGEVRTYFEYRGQRGPIFGWLHVDPETLKVHAKKMEWSCQVILQENSGDYLARLTRMG
jgi:SAM-dependent methyltransferase